MKRSKAIQIITRASKADLLKKADIATRGLSDITVSSQYKKMQDEMIDQFKAEKFKLCIKTCNKLLQIKPDAPLVHLLLLTSKSKLTAERQSPRTKKE